MSDDRGGWRSAAGGSEHLDLAIDRAVREMVDIEPPADLRAKVIARIEQPSALGSEFSAFGTRLSAFGWLRFGVPVAAAAALVLVLAVMLARRSEPTVQPRTVAQASDMRLPGPGAPSLQMRPAAPPALTAAVSQPARRTPASMVSAATIEGAADTTGIEPLKTITPIEVAPISQASIAPEPIAVRPLNPITEVQIAPLTPPDRRD